MPNTYFQFKQFTIHQEHCAMKVSTDACILGAWVASKNINVHHALDIGAGTGLLSLMLAQKYSCKIDAIEIESACFEQLKENIGGSPWKGRLNPIHGDVRQLNVPQQYDYIISNPPFYETDLQSPAAAKNLAKHSIELNLEELMVAIKQHMQPEGSFTLLLPFQRMVQVEQLALQQHFYLLEKLLIRQTPTHNYFRSVLHFSAVDSGMPIQSELIIRKEDGIYTEEFKELLKDYYLKL